MNVQITVRILVHLTIIIHSSHKILYCLSYSRQLSSLSLVQASAVTQAVLFTPSFYALNKPAFLTIQLNHIFSPSFNHLVLDSFVQPDNQPVSPSLLYTLSQLFSQSVPPSSTHSASYTASQSLSLVHTQPVNQPISPSLLYTLSQIISQSVPLSCTHSASYSASQSARLSPIHAINCACCRLSSQSFTLSLSQVFCQSFAPSPTR
jgi:hypothetical protein